MAIVVNKKTNYLYRYLGENKFKNIVTEAEGVVEDEVAQRTFAISLSSTEIVEQNPLVEDFIKRLNLKIDR